MLAGRINTTDHHLASSVGAEIRIGQAFAFISADAFRRPELGWVQTILGGSALARPRVISLLDRRPVMLPGATLKPAPIPPLSLAVVTSDKALYREGRDEVHLLALDPLSPGAEIALEIQANNADFGRHAARLDARGAAAVSLRDLPTGEYEVRFRGAPKDAPACAFTVAEYRLAPLVASLVDRRLEAGGATLAVQIKLESFGSPVDGRVLLELTDRGSRLSQLSAEARGGLCEAKFAISGAGPHAINAQLAADPSRTATVPIVGSRAAERSRTTLSTLGTEVSGSLLPSEGSRPVRGIYLEDGAARSTPFRLDRVDTRKARITAVTRVETARVVVIDPTYPFARPGAVDPVTATHPAHVDEKYKLGEKLFLQGKVEAAHAVFDEALASQAGAPHPNYRYYIACCFAREGDVPRALAMLRAAIQDGFSDFEHMVADDDLAALRGNPAFEAIKAGGRQEIALEDLIAGSTIEIDVPGPMALLAIGAYVAGEPWEGWAATIAPAEIAPRITVPSRATPGSDARIEVDSGRAGDGVSVYLVIKDARLLSPDTPASRLAGGLKAYAEGAGKELATGKPTTTLAEAIPRPVPPPPPMMYRGAPPPPGAYAPTAAWSVDEMTLGGAIPPPAPGGFGPPQAFGGPMGAPPVAAAAPMAAAPKGGRASAALGAVLGRTGGPGAAAPAAAPGPYREAPPPPPPSIEEPEVLFASLIEIEGGRGAVSVRLGPDFADYIVEAFAISGADWAPAEARFRAEKEVFASLEIPAFVHPADTAVARVHVGSRGGARVRVTRDGADVPLSIDGRAFVPGEQIAAGRAELAFLAGPGLYEASIDDGAGHVERIEKRVDEPGKFRRIARSVRFLEPGQGLSRSHDPGILSLRVLPGLEKPFTALTDATSSYGHACCEQTAAKMLAACAMYALAEDRSRRDKAEAIILAGVRREASMWLRGRGFKMYPESSNEPNVYWGTKAARYLWDLALLRDLPGDDAPGRALSGAIDQGLEMASDATRAFGMEWPPTRPSSCEEAYAAIRFGRANGAAIDLVRKRTAAGAPAGPRPESGAVGMRAETAYGAAALLRGGSGPDRQRAISLTNAVVSELGPHGRLYSTVDSVAAIALMVELSAAKIVGGSGSVEVDGRRISTANAIDLGDQIRQIRAVEGITAVEVTRLVEEDWGAFQSGVQVAVSLNRGGAPTRRLNALDAAELVVTIESGYKAGDLCWVCLPDALSRVVGGGQVKRFSVDFRGQSQVRVPLAATGITVGPSGQDAPAHFAVCVRNMFEEERGGNPGYLEITVAPPGEGTLLDRARGALRGLFGG